VNATKRGIEAVREVLFARKRELEKQLTQMAQEQFSDGQVQDSGDQALISTMESLRMTFQDTEIGEYHRIVRALEKIEKGTYGICMDCGNPISEKRLKSFPDAGRCLVCQEAFEDQAAAGQ